MRYMTRGGEVATKVTDELFTVMLLLVKSTDSTSTWRFMPASPTPNVNHVHRMANTVANEGADR